MSLSGFYIMKMLDSCTLEKFGKTFLHNVFVKSTGLKVFSVRNLKMMYLAITWKLTNYVFTEFSGGLDLLLSLLKAWVQLLVGKLRYRKLHGMTKTLK